MKALWPLRNAVTLAGRQLTQQGTQARRMATTAAEAVCTAIDCDDSGSHRIATLDTDYAGPMSAYLVQDAGRAAFVDVNTRFAVPRYVHCACWLRTA